MPSNIGRNAARPGPGGRDAIDYDDHASTDGDVISPYGALAYFQDLNPDIGDFRSDVLAGLSRPQKNLSPKYFYDERGSQIFDDITRVADYYPTRTEKSIISQNADAISDAIGPDRAVFEYGAGSLDKVGRLLALMAQPKAYVAMDISRDYLLTCAEALVENLSIPVGAICADFTTPLRLPTNGLPAIDQWLGFFPGSTLGNLDLDGAAAFLTRAAKTLGADAQFFLGIDLDKDDQILRAAYDDNDGVTAAFNMNLLHRIQKELDGDLQIDDFEHTVAISRGPSGAGPKRVEMHLRARRATEIGLRSDEQDYVFSFAEGETLHTENSHKYSLAELDALFARTPWRRLNSWTDEQGWFATCLLSNS